MSRRPFFKLLSTLTLLFYCCTFVHAGQVITSSERDWAKKALSQETQLGTIDSSQSIAVLYFHNQTAQKKLNPLQKGLALMLITDLSKVDNLFVVERVRLQALYDEMNIGESGLVDETTAPRIGKLVKAYYVVGGDIREGSKQQLQFDSRLIDVPFDSTTVLPMAVGSVDDLLRMEKDLLFSIVERLKVPFTPEQRKKLEEPLSLSLAALFALFLGIDYSDKGNYTKASEMYSRAMAEDPGLELAESSLQELKDMGLMSSEDISRIDPSVEEAAAEGGMSWGTIGAITLGLAAVGGGIALFASSSSDDDDGGGDSTGEGDGPTVYPTKAEGLCLGDSVTFSFSESMNMSGTASVDWSGSVVFNGWQADDEYVVSWTGGSSECISTTTPSLTVSFNPKSFTSTGGETLTGTTSFTIGTN